MKTQSKPDPEEFARKVLWQLSGLRAESRIMLQMLSRQIEPEVPKADEIYREWIHEALRLQSRLYKEAVEAVGIPPPKAQNSQPSGD